MAAAAAASSTPENSQDRSVHIIYVDRPESEDPEPFHVRTLASVLGSEEAAKDAIIYHYTHAASGFSAKLTAEQAEQLETRATKLQGISRHRLKEEVIRLKEEVLGQQVNEAEVEVLSRPRLNKEALGCSRPNEGESKASKRPSASNLLSRPRTLSRPRLIVNEFRPNCLGRKVLSRPELQDGNDLTYTGRFS